MNIEFISFDKNNIVEEGEYWIITKKKYGYGYLSANVSRNENTMTVGITNQEVLFISTKPCKSWLN